MNTMIVMIRAFKNRIVNNCIGIVNPTTIFWLFDMSANKISKEPIIEVAQANEAESSGLKKILETALDVKNGDSDLGIIRDAKNQLFALDFKKDKTKRN